MLEGYKQIALATIPVYLFILIGFLSRKIGWLNQRSDESLLKLQINIFYPCLIFSYIFGNEALRDPKLLVLPPLIGFSTIVIGFVFALLVAKWIGLSQGKGLRTFAFTSGVYNYGFIAIPLIQSIYNSKSITGTLMVHNSGVELAIWTIGILILTGKVGKDSWKQMLNPPVIALLAGVLLNFLFPPTNAMASGFSGEVQERIISTIGQLGQIAIPIALILIGASIRDLLGDQTLKFDWKIMGFGCSVRLFLMPIVFIALAVLLPLPSELKAVMLVQAAMPCGMFPIIMAKHFGGSPQVAVQLVISTTALSILTIPFWITIGQHFAG